MGKRSDFERVERDFYPTPLEAVLPLKAFLKENTKFSEPCAGDGRLVKHLESLGHTCIWQSDIEPQSDFIAERSVFDVTETNGADVFITNPPWNRKILHPLIEHLSDMAPTWLLFDADWMHTKQSIPYLHRLKKIVSVGRVKWIEDSKSTGKDNCCWYLFHLTNQLKAAEFYGRY